MTKKVRADRKEEPGWGLDTLVFNGQGEEKERAKNIPVSAVRGKQVNDCPGDQLKEVY